MKVTGAVTVLLSIVWYSVVDEFRNVSSRILWSRFKFSRVKVCAVVVYDPTTLDDKEGEIFLHKFGRVLNRIDNGNRFCVTRDLKGWNIMNGGSNQYLEIQMKMEGEL